MGRLGILLLAWAGGAAAQIKEADSYKYQLELNADAKLCRQMEKVYNAEFRRPWQRGKGKDSGKIADSFYSTSPSSAEFAAVKWREGKSFYSGSSSPQAATLVVELDIDNDGAREVLVKSQFMRSAVASGPSDQLWVLKRAAADPAKPLDMNRVFGKAREDGTRQISSVTLRYTEKDRPAEVGGERMGAALIRPFVANGKTYLSVYVPWAVDDPKQRREWMWVMAYRGGGNSTGPGKWEPAKVDRLCRFRMVSS
jgi:hypothetical protein